MRATRPGPMWTALRFVEFLTWYFACTQLPAPCYVCALQGANAWPLRQSHNLFVMRSMRGGKAGPWLAPMPAWIER